MDINAVFPPPYRLEMLDPLALPNTGKNARFLFLPIWGNEKGYGFAYDFFGSVSKNAFRALVPARNDAVEVLCEDGVEGPDDYCGKLLLSVGKRRAAEQFVWQIAVIPSASGSPNMLDH